MSISLYFKTNKIFSVPRKRRNEFKTNHHSFEKALKSVQYFIFILHFAMISKKHKEAVNDKFLSNQPIVKMLCNKKVIQYLNLKTASSKIRHLQARIIWFDSHLFVSMDHMKTCM